MGTPVNKVSRVSPRPVTPTQNSLNGTKMSDSCQAERPTWIAKRIAAAKLACKDGMLDVQHLETSCGTKDAFERPLRNYGVMLNCVPIHPSWKQIPKASVCAREMPGWVAYQIYKEKTACSQKGPEWRFTHNLNIQWCGIGEGWFTYNPTNSVQTSCSRSSDRVGGYDPSRK